MTGGLGFTKLSKKKKLLESDLKLASYILYTGRLFWIHKKFLDVKINIWCIEIPKY